MTSDPATILIADDHPLVRSGLRMALESLSPPPSILEAESAKQVRGLLSGRSAPRPRLDLILLDLFMPDVVGFELLSQLCSELTWAPVLVLSASQEPEHMRQAMRCGAAGYVDKAEGEEVLLSAVRLILSGGVYLPPALLADRAPNERDTLDPLMSSGRGRALTERQREVLGLICCGHSNKQIARELCLSENTVKIHVAAIFRTLGVSNRTQAALIGRTRPATG